MPYYHVRITQKSRRSNDEVRLDLSLDGLEHVILEPYRRGLTITTGGKSIPTGDIERIRITKTEQDSNYLRPTAELDRRSGGIVIASISVEWYIADLGEDVTDEFITGPPGSEVEESNTSKQKSSSATSTRVFISHSDNDVEVAKLLIELIRKALHLRSDEIRCTSVDGYRMTGGASIDERLRTEVHDAELLIGLITPDWLRSAYVVFELGARWGADKPMIPLLASGATPEDLEGPLSGINALNSSVDGQVHQFLEDAAKYLNLSLDKASSYTAAVDELVRVASESTPTEESQPGISDHPQLSAEARTLLTEAVKSSTRAIMKANTVGGLIIQANGNNLCERGNPRSEAIWEGALKDLIIMGLVEDQKGKGEVFVVTREGFQVANDIGDAEQNV